VKKVVTALDLLAAVAEMSSAVGGKVENIYRTGAGYIFKLSSGYIAATRFRVSLTGVVLEKTHEGAETLRGLFRDERLAAISMPRFDRIVELSFSSGRLVAELLEPFNMAAVREGRVVWLLHSYRGKDRELRPGLPYVYPPAVFVDVLTADVDAIEKAIDPNDVRRSLIRRLGTGPELADELTARAGTPPRALAEELKALVERVRSDRLEPAVCIRGGVPVTVLPIRPVSIQCDEVRQFDHFWAALDYYFTPLELESAATQKTQGLALRRRKLEATIAELDKKVPEYRAEAARLKTIAHKLLMYKSEIEEALGGRESGVRIVNVNGSRVKVELPEGDVVEVARGVPLGRQVTNLFNEAKELEEKASRAVQVLERLKKELAKVEEEQRRIEKEVRTSAKAVAKKSWFEKFRWSITAGKRPMIGGRDASQNETVVRKYLKNHYLFFHADIPGASAVVTPPMDDLLEVYQVAQFAAAYSRAWKIGIHAIDVYYVRGEQVSKQPPSGQYLAKGSFMVYGKREYVRNIRLELAIGCRRDGDVYRAVATPPRSAPLLAEKYVVVTPGNVEKNKLAKEIAKLGKCSIDDITAVLPGPSRISEEGRGSTISWEEVEQIFATW
jgi:predicted ribosome quality control (RQC) complex YloA/Tae2 family protein